MVNKLRKLGFPLQPEDGWPPFEIEHLWVEPIGLRFIVKNSPFFVKNLAYDDVITAKFDRNGYVRDWSLVSESGNSTIWVILKSASDVLERLSAIGCGIEGEPIDDLYSVNVPPGLDMKLVDGVLRPLDSDGIVAVAYPAFRHKE